MQAPASAGSLTLNSDNPKIVVVSRIRSEFRRWLLECDAHWFAGATNAL
jgi:hypothetical protein